MNKETDLYNLKSICSNIRNGIIYRTAITRDHFVRIICVTNYLKFCSLN